MNILCALVLSVAILSVMTQARPGGGAEAFEKLKALVGHWETDKTNMNKATLDLELTSGGTAVMEKSAWKKTASRWNDHALLFGRRSDQADTLLHDRNPTDDARTYAPETKTLKFNLESITNLKSADSGHMHHATYTFLDNDHFKTTWTFRKDQKDSFTEDVTYVRTK